MVERPLVAATDPLAHMTVGDTPYARVPVDDIHDPITLARLGRDAIDRRLSLPDRKLTPRGARSSRDAPAGVVFDAQVVSENTALGAVTEPALAIPLGGTVAGGRGLTGAVDVARGTRLVILDRSWFSSDIQLAHVTLALVSAGVAVSIEDPETLRGLLDPSLVDLLRPGSSANDDPLEAEAMSAAQRREAWRGHDLVTALDDRGVRLVPRRLPTISVLLSTNRPSLIDACLQRIAGQSHPDVEVIVAMHGVDARGARESFHQCGLPGMVLEIEGSVPLGAVLNEAAAASSGQLVTKWDDDDLYGADHLVDMCLGLRYSGADMVGKAPEFIYFEREHRTVLRNHSGFEADSTVISGGTITMSRLAFDDLGGFPLLPRAVDHYLKRALIAQGGTIYRMHPFGFVLVRHELGHTWEPAHGELASGVERSWVGIPPITGVPEGGPA